MQVLSIFLLYIVAKNEHVAQVQNVLKMEENQHTSQLLQSQVILVRKQTWCLFCGGWRLKSTHNIFVFKSRLNTYFHWHLNKFVILFI